MSITDRWLGWLPKGTSPVAFGIIVNGVATYVFLVVPARSGRLDPEAYATFSAVWFAAYLLGPGLYIPLEQELGRLTAQARAVGRPGDQAARTALTLVALSGGIVALGIFGARTPIARGFFEGDRAAATIVALSILASGAAQWAKGWLAGSHAFGRYGVLVGVEGMLRAVAVVALAIVGVTSATLYALPIGLTPLLAAAFVLVTARPDLRVGEPVALRRMTTDVGTLAIAQIGAQFLMNGVPLMLALYASGSERQVVGRLGAALVLARVPLFLFQAIQASLLPGLSTLAELEDWHGFRRRVRTVTIGLAVLGSTAVGVGAALGPFATRVFFGAEFVASSAEFGALSLSAVVIVLALVMAQSLIALARHRLVAVGWALGAVTFIVVGAIGSGLEWRALGAGIAGPVVALAVLALALRSTVPQV